MNVMTQEQLFKIAMLIDNEYIGKEKTFWAAKRAGGYWYLSTNVCDWASVIKIFETNNKISSIIRLADDTDGWQEITNATWVNIEKYLQTLTGTELNYQPQKV